MSNKEFQLILMYVTLLLVAISVLLFIFRAIKILISKEFELKDDMYFTLFLLCIMCVIGYCWYKIKSVFKKLKKPVV